MRHILLRNSVHPSPGSGAGATINPSASTLREGIVAKKPLPECRVLVVDDDSSNTELMRFRLRKEVKSVDTAGTAAGAIAKISEAAKGEKYDLVICDMRLDGSATALDVEKEATKAIPSALFIIASGLRADELPQGAIHLKKPCTKEEVLALLSGHFPSN